MTAYNYAKLRDNTVEPMLTRFGKAATLTQPGTSTGDEWDPTPGTPTEYAVTVVETSFTSQEKAGGLVREDDRKFIMSTAGDPDPSLNGTLTVGSTTLQIVNVTPLQPGAVVMMYTLHCRK
jgi:hypothetical protein